MTEIDVKSLKKALKEALNGIDEDSLDSDDGWWETSTGADFGKEKLEELLGLIDKHTVSKDTTDKYLGGCEAIKKKYNLTSSCCSTCHTNYDDYDVSMHLIEVDDGYYEVCCDVHNEFGKFEPQDTTDEHAKSQTGQEKANEMNCYVPCRDCEECGYLCTHPDRNVFNDCCPLEHDPDCEGCHYNKECEKCKGEGGFHPEKDTTDEYVKKESLEALHLSLVLQTTIGRNELANMIAKRFGLQKGPVLEAIHLLAPGLILCLKEDPDINEFCESMKGYDGPGAREDPEKQTAVLTYKSKTGEVKDFTFSIPLDNDWDDVIEELGNEDPVKSCEWEYDNYQYNTSCGTSIGELFYSSRMKYCPYCGKEIVIE